MKVLAALSSPGARRVKRFVDLILAGTALIVLAPVLVCIAVAVGLAMGRPVIFRQRRIGLHEAEFPVYKFRTLDEAVTDANGAERSSEDRVTSLGWFLRRTSLDELPQLVNVLRGDLSLIGPRPLLPHYLPAYTGRERLRHTVRPGISGLAQISGRNQLSWDDKLELDVQYVEHWSLLLDARIGLRTIAMLIRWSDDVVRDPAGEGDLARLRATQSPPAAHTARGGASSAVATQPAGPLGNTPGSRDDKGA